MFKTINDGKLPTRGSKYSACVDLYASEDVVICAGETVMLGLGVCIDLEPMHTTAKLSAGYTDDDLDIFKKSHYLQLMLRSSLGKKGLIIPNGVGVIDLDYEDEIKVLIHNPLKLKWWNEKNEGYLFPKVKSDTSYSIKKGDRIAQITLLEHKSYLFGIDIDTTRNGGFGSTD